MQGKSQTLKYIKESLPHIPIPDFVPVPVDIKWGLVRDFLGVKKRKLAKELGFPLIVRSNAKQEDGLGHSYAGVFNSKIVRDASGLERAVYLCRETYSSEDASVYASRRGIKPPQGPIDIMFQRYSDPVLNCVITRHPNRDDLFFVDLETNIHSAFPNRFGFMIHEGMSPDVPINVFMNQFPDNKLAFYLFMEENYQEQLSMALEHYKEVERLEGFSADIVYQMECALFPYTFVQWRSLRKKEKADFRIDDVAPEVDDELILRAPTVFGITPSEGLDVLHFANHSYGMYPRGQGTAPWESEVDMIWELGKPIMENGIPVAFSFYEIGRYASALDKRSEVLPAVSLFHYGLTLHDPEQRPVTTYPWQVHDTFRLLEREATVAFLSQAPMVDHFQKMLRYWSDGIEWRVQILK